MQTALIFNTLSGARSAKRNRALVKKLQQVFPEGIASYEANSSQALQSALNEILTGSTDRLLISGGDGTLNFVVNTLLSHAQYRRIPIGLIPYGTGNSFALDLNIHSLEDALISVQKNKTVLVDVGKLTHQNDSKYFVNNFGIGLVYDIAHTASKMRFLGAFSYTLATLFHLIRLSPMNITMQIDGQNERRSVFFLDVCNSQYTGGDMRIAPDVSLNDGRFQMVSLQPTGRLSLLKAFPKIFAGQHLNEPFVKTQFVTAVEIESASAGACLLDGELSLPLPATVEMTSHKLPFFTL